MKKNFFIFVQFKLKFSSKINKNSFLLFYDVHVCDSVGEIYYLAYIKF